MIDFHFKTGEKENFKKILNAPFYFEDHCIKTTIQKKNTFVA